jgi:hypothetical protein
MAVTIDLELKAGDVATEITGIATALETLEAAAGDVDLDFDELDVDEISGEIGNMVDMLESLELDLSGLEEDLDRIENLDDIEIEANVNTPDGETNSGDSQGKPVIKTGGFLDAQQKAKDVSTTTDGGSRANLFERTYGEHTLASEDFLGNWLQKPKSSQTSNLGADDPDFTSGFAGRIGTRTGFGNDPVSMDWRRQAGSESMEAFRRGADPSHGSGPGRVDTLEDRIREFKQHSVNMVDGFKEAMEKRDEAASPIDTPFGDNGLNFDRRMSELTTSELNDLMENPAQGEDGFMGEGNSDFVNEMAESMAEAQYDAFGGADDEPFGGVNTELRNSELSGSEMYDIHRQAQPGGGGIDFSIGSGGRSSRSNRDIIDNNSILSRVDNMTSLGNVMDEVGDAQSKLGKKFRSLRPTMGQYMQLLAAIIPVAVALGTQLLGVAAAMGAVAAAGGAVMGLGLLGHAESLEGSVEQAKQQVQDLKQEMFEVFQPTMQQFAPIQSQMFDAMPEGMGGIAESMEGLTVYEDTLYELGSSLSGGFEKAINIIVENEQAISQLTTRFGGLIGSGLLNFFEWLIQAASKNQQLLVELGQDMLKLAVAAYNVSMAISKVLTAFSPLFDLLVFISEVLNSEIIVGLVTMIGWLFVLGKAALVIWGVYQSFMALAAGIKFATMLMFSYEMSTWGAVAATLALVAAIGLLTLGAATVIGGAVTSGAMGAQDVPTGPSGGGGPGGPGGGGGQQTVYNDNRSYTINSGGGDDYASQKAMEDTISRVNETNEAQSLPVVETNSSNSDDENSS